MKYASLLLVALPLFGADAALIPTPMKNDQFVLHIDPKLTVQMSEGIMANFQTKERIITLFCDNGATIKIDLHSGKVTLDKITPDAASKEFWRLCNKVYDSVQGPSH